MILGNTFRTHKFQGKTLLSFKCCVNTEKSKKYGLSVKNTITAEKTVAHRRQNYTCPQCKQEYQVLWGDGTNKTTLIRFDTNASIKDSVAAFHRLQKEAVGRVLYNVKCLKDSYNIEAYSKLGRYLKCKACGIDSKELHHFIKKYSQRFKKILEEIEC